MVESLRHLLLLRHVGNQCSCSAPVGHFSFVLLMANLNVCLDPRQVPMTVSTLIQVTAFTCRSFLQAIVERQLRRFESILIIEVASAAGQDRSAASTEASFRMDAGGSHSAAPAPPARAMTGQSQMQATQSPATSQPSSGSSPSSFRYGGAADSKVQPGGQMHQEGGGAHGSSLRDSLEEQLRSLQVLIP